VELGAAGWRAPGPPGRHQAVVSLGRVRGEMSVWLARARAGGDRLLLCELGAVQVGVQSPGREQLIVVAALADLAVVDDQDLIGLADRGQPVRDDNRGTP